jgi:hypothetical protein
MTKAGRLCKLGVNIGNRRRAGQFWTASTFPKPRAVSGWYREKTFLPELILHSDLLLASLKGVLGIRDVASALSVMVSGPVGAAGRAVVCPLGALAIHRRNYPNVCLPLVREGLNGARIILLDTAGRCSLLYRARR